MGTAISGRTFLVWCLAETALLQVCYIPRTFTFEHIVFSEFGANLSVNHMLARGLIPTVDFGYVYGLLTPLLTRLWFLLAPQTPFGYQLLILGIQWVITVLWARLSPALKLSFAGQIFLMMALPYVIRPTFPSFAHAMETVLLLGAIGGHARERYGLALSLTVLAVGFRQGLGFFYLPVLVFAVLYRGRQGKGNWKAELAWPAAVALVSHAIQYLFFGLGPLMKSVFPISSAVNYKGAGVGFQRQFLNFLFPQGVNWKFYLGTVVGFWIVASVLLLGAGLWLLWTRRAGSLKGELAAAMGWLHLTATVVLFGNAMSWGKYFFILVVGTAALESASVLGRLLVPVLTLQLFLSHKSSLADTIEAWRTQTRSSATAGLWADPVMKREWAAVLERVRGEKPALFMITGAAEVLFPQFGPPETFALYVNLPNEKEIERKLKQLNKATLIVQFYYEGQEDALYNRSTRPLTDFIAAKGRLETAGRYFKIYVMKPPGAG